MSKLLNELLTRKRLWWFGVTVSLVLFILSTILSIILCIAYFYDVGIFWYYFRVCFCVFCFFFVFNAGDKKLIIYIFFYFWHLSQNEMAFLKLIFLLFYFLSNCLSFVITFQMLYMFFQVLMFLLWNMFFSEDFCIFL